MLIENPSSLWFYERCLLGSLEFKWCASRRHEALLDLGARFAGSLPAACWSHKLLIIGVLPLLDCIIVVGLRLAFEVAVIGTGLRRGRDARQLALLGGVVQRAEVLWRC